MMKTQQTLIVIFSLAIGFAVGLMAGITITSPGMNLREAAGTIGRVDQYRNVRVTEADIELRNELLTNENMREAYRNYLSYEYASNIKMGEDIRFAIAASYDADIFHIINQRTIHGLEEYAEFLDNTRLRILEALGVISDLSDRDRVAIRTVLNNAGNALAQTQFRNGVLFDFMLGVERFFDTNPKAQFPNLAKAHDQLFSNILISTMINDNRPVLEHLLAKALMDEDGELAKLDMETLRGFVLRDMGNLKDIAFLSEEIVRDIAAINDNVSFLDTELLRNLGVFDAEQLRITTLDSDQLQTYKDALRIDGDQLEVILDVLRMDEVLRGSEMMRSSDFLRSQVLRDGEQLRSNIPVQN
ncbi:MAG: hypothetical protein EA394_10200 [Bacteroidia bacterium]|nr:MAG: hypothetical protein EA394_10200 [Bacteroidia bacterium]